AHVKVEKSGCVSQPDWPAVICEAKTKTTPRKLVYDESEKEDLDSFDIEGEGESEDNGEDLSMPYKRPKPTPFTTRITRFKHQEKAKLPRNVKVYEGSKDPKDDLGIFSAAAKQEEWLITIWCRMFHHTLSGATRNWFDDLDPKSMKNFEELSQMFLEEFSQQKGAKGNSENRKCELPTASIASGNSEKNLNKFCDYHGNRGHNTNDRYHLKKQIEDAVASGKLTHWVKDIRRGNQKNESQRRGGIKVLNMELLKGIMSEGSTLTVGVHRRSCMSTFFKSFDVDVKSCKLSLSISFHFIGSETEIKEEEDVKIF
nr:reverse transcriptase domain-containing protein [Tanacetum cinerariifolium]